MKTGATRVRLPRLEGRSCGSLRLTVRAEISGWSMLSFRSPDPLRRPTQSASPSAFRNRQCSVIKVFKHETGSPRVSTPSTRPGSSRTAESCSGSSWTIRRPRRAGSSSDVFHIHELAIEDALNEIHHPEDRVVRRLPLPDPARHRLPGPAARLQDQGRRLLPGAAVPDHRPPRRVAVDRRAWPRSARATASCSAKAPPRCCTGSSTRWSTTTGRRSTSSQQRLDKLETDVFERPNPKLARQILDFKRDVASLRQVVLPQRDAVGRLARREFPLISEQLAYRFRDVHDHLVRLSDEAMFFQDRISGILDAHLSAVSNQLNSVMKVLTLISTIFLPLTVLTGMYGMNVDAAAHAGRRRRRSSGGSAGDHDRRCRGRRCSSVLPPAQRPGS